MNFSWIFCGFRFGCLNISMQHSFVKPLKHGINLASLTYSCFLVNDKYAVTSQYMHVE